MRSVYSFLKNLNYAYLCVVGLLVKSIVFGINYPDFLITVPVLALEGFKLYIKSKTPPPAQIDAELRKEINNIKDKLGTMDIAKSTKPQGNIRYF
jgi:hypothetical protein